jgi:hypothetical protein
MQGDAYANRLRHKQERLPDVDGSVRNDHVAGITETLRIL